MTLATDRDQPTAPAPSSQRSLVIASLALAVVLVVALAVITQVLSSHNAADRRHRQAAAATYLAGSSARAAAAAAAIEVKATLTYNYKTLPADFAAAERGLTAHFRPSYVQTTKTSVTPLASKYHATSTAAVEAAGVSAAGPDAATVLVFVDQTVTNTQLAQPRLDRSRIRVSMRRVGGRWLVDNLEPL